MAEVNEVLPRITEGRKSAVAQKENFHPALKVFEYLGLHLFDGVFVVKLKALDRLPLKAPLKPSPTGHLMLLDEQKHIIMQTLVSQEC
jgi:hypothetical protein